MVLYDDAKSMLRLRKFKKHDRRGPDSIESLSYDDASQPSFSRCAMQPGGGPALTLSIGPSGRPPHASKFRVSSLTVNCIANLIPDVKLNNLIFKLRVLKLSLIKPHMSFMEIFEYVDKINSYPNVSITYQNLFTIPVMMVASNERSFLMLK